MPPRVQHVPVVGIPRRDVITPLQFAERVFVPAAYGDDLSAIDAGELVEVRFCESASADNADPDRRICWHYLRFLLSARWPFAVIGFVGNDRVGQRLRRGIQAGMRLVLTLAK